MTLYSIQSFRNVPIFFRDSVLDSLSAKQKRMILIASVAFSCIAALYLYCKYGFKAKQNQEKHEDKPDDKPLIASPLPRKNENSHGDKPLVVQDKKGADQRQLGDEKKPILDDKKMRVDGKKPADKKPQAETKNENLKEEEEKKKDDPKDSIEKPKQADPLPSPLAKKENVVGPVANPKVDPVETSRMIYQGLHTKSRLTESQFEDLSQKFDSYRQDSKMQANFLNSDKDVLFIDFNGFAKTHGISEPDLEALCRYLILEGKIYAYHREKERAFKLYLTEQSSLASDESLNIKRLKKIDSYMESLSFPSLDHFTQDEKEIAEKVIEEIKKSHYKRIRSNRFSYVWLHDVFAFQQHANEVMDKLVREGVIHSWNAQTGTRLVLLKIKFDDPCDKAPIAESTWRDLDTLQQEDMFQKAHHISIEPDLVKSSHLIPEQQKNLWKLVELLNRRVKPGVCYWYGEYAFNDVLDFLKQNGCIHDYKQSDQQNVFEIYVSAADL